MSEQLNETFLKAITDDLGDAFFDGAASSKNVITTQDDDKKEPKTEKKEEDKDDLGNFNKPDNFSASDVLGDRLEEPVEQVIDSAQKDSTQEKPKEKKEENFDFLLDNKVLAPFADDTAIKSKKDLEQLIKANKEHWVTEAKVEAIKELEDTLPEEIKFLVDYAKRGGDDLKSVFKLLSQSQEFRDYDLEKADDQKALIRSYYATQGWTEDETEDEIVNLVESNRLQTQAQKIKPKLDRINQDQLEQKKEQQKFMDEQQTKARKAYEDNVIKALKPGKLGDIKLTKEEQVDLYNALTREQYQSISGVTNRLGALLDKIQYMEPNYELLAKVTMYLTDPISFEKRLKDQITTDVTAEQVKKIKTEQQKQQIGSSHKVENDTKRLPKLGSSFINPF